MATDDGAAQWRGNIRKVNLLKICIAGSAISTSIITLFWRKMGMSTTEIFAVQAIFHLALALLEVPTGRFGDRTGRKPSVVIGVFTLALGFTMYAFCTNVVEVILAELVLALGFSFVSGSLQALQYDSILALGSRESDLRVIGNSETYFYAACAVFTILGSLLATVSLELAVAVAAVPGWFGAMVALTLKEAPYHEGKKDVPLGQVVREYFVGMPDVRWVVLFSAFVAAALTAGQWFYQDCMVRSELPVWTFGLVYAGFSVVAALSARWARKREWSKETIFGLPLLLVVGYAALAATATNWSFVFIALLRVVRGCNDVAVETRLNRAIQSNVRATMLSLKSLCSSAMFVVIGLTVGVLGDCCGLSVALAALAGLCMVATIGFWLFRPNREVKALNTPVTGMVEVPG